MKIGVIVKPVVSNAAYRAITPMLALGGRGHEVVLVKVGANKKLSLRDLLNCDVVHIYRCLDEPGIFNGIEELQRRGVAITWDDDDDVRLVPAESPGSKQVFSGMNVERGLRLQRTMFSKVDLVTTTTQALADLFGLHFDGPIEVIENYLDSSQYTQGRRSHEGIVIGWVASLEHLADVRMLELTPMLRNVMARDDRIRVTTIGVKLDLNADRYTFVPAVRFHDLVTHLANFDIGIAPIADHPMSHTRSNIKVKEYAAAGVPWAASARGSYAAMGTRQGGITVADDRWEQTLVDLAASRFRRMRLRRNAESWSKAQHISHHADRWERAMEMAVERATRHVA